MVNITIINISFYFTKEFTDTNLMDLPKLQVKKNYQFI